MSWLISGAVGGVPCRYLLDTGAEFTILQRGLLPLQPLSSQSPVIQAAGAFVKDGSASLYGPRFAFLDIGGVRIPMNVYEADIHDQCLLGGDFVAAHVARFDPQSDDLRLHTPAGPRRVPVTRVTRPSHVNTTSASLRVCALHAVTVPPKSEVFVTVSVSNCDSTWTPRCTCAQFLRPPSPSPCHLASRSGLAGGADDDHVRASRPDSDCRRGLYVPGLCVRTEGPPRAAGTQHQAVCHEGLCVRGLCLHPDGDFAGRFEDQQGDIVCARYALRPCSCQSAPQVSPCPSAC